MVTQLLGNYVVLKKEKKEKAKLRENMTNEEILSRTQKLIMTIGKTRKAYFQLKKMLRDTKQTQFEEFCLLEA